MKHVSSNSSEVTLDLGDRAIGEEVLLGHLGHPGGSRVRVDGVDNLASNRMRCGGKCRGECESEHCGSHRVSEALWRELRLSREALGAASEPCERNGRNETFPREK